MSRRPRRCACTNRRGGGSAIDAAGVRRADGNRYRCLLRRGGDSSRIAQPMRSEQRHAAADRVVHLSGVVDAAACDAWSTMADRVIADGLAGRIDAPGWSAASSSARLATCSGFALAKLLSRLWRGPLRSASFERLGGHAVCDLDQCWLRRQYPPGAAPPGHHPHAWHQDGALGFDFLGAAGHERDTADDLLAMVTFWIPLVPCGVDAPGLELIDAPMGRLLRPDELVPSRLRERHAPEDFVRPVLAAGDALLFGGDVVHRTHLTATMTRARTSLELRCFPGARLPARLAGDRWAKLPPLS